jgi:serine/threonine-protein kinase
VSSSVPDHALRRLLADAEPLLEEATRLPERIGKYRVVRVLGRGGMGVVYEAHDDELGRKVALKVLDPAAAASPALRERFLREARAAAKLTHPHIAAVYDAGEGWIAMRLVAGGPLHEAPRADLRTRVAQLRDAALALQHAHEMGIVHRDVKPHNLLLEGDHLFVADFGLAKEIAADSSLSLSGHVLGSPSYMTPEQAQGRVHDIDARTDVYGLAATLFHVIGGRPPFVESDVVRLLKRIAEEEPPRLSALVAGVPRDLETIVLKGLEKERERRYQSARELADELGRWLRGEPVLARRATLAYRAAKFTRRHRALVALSVATALALAIAGAAAWSERVGQRASDRSLELAEQVSAVVADFSTHWRLGDVEEANRRLDEGIAACEAFLREHDVARGHWLLGKLARMHQQSERARAELDRALGLDPDLIEARLERGFLLAGQIAAARSRLPNPDGELPPELAELRTRAVADLEAADRERTRLSAVAAAQAKAELLRLRDDRAGARKAFLELNRLDPVNSDMQMALSQLALADGDGEAAWEHAMSLMDFAQGLGPAYVARRDDAQRAVNQHAFTAAHDAVAAGDRSAEALDVLANARLRIDDVEGAFADFTQALAVDPKDALAMGNRALVRARQAARLAAQGKLEEALSTWDDAIGDVSGAITLDPTLVGAWNNRAVSHGEKERLLVRLARLEESAAERRAAGADLDEALRLNPRFVLARLNRAGQRRRVAEQAASAGDWPQAEAALLDAGQDAAEALRLRASDPSLWLERARTEDLESELFAARGDAVAAGHSRDLARADYDVAVGLASDDGRPLGLRGLHRAKAHDFAGARADFTAALAAPLDRELEARLRAELARLPQEAE